MSKALVEIEDDLPVRRDYVFNRPLESWEAELLAYSISWRTRSEIVPNESGQVTGCTAHPDDMGAFLSEQRRQKDHGSDRLKATHQPFSTKAGKGATQMTKEQEQLKVKDQLGLLDELMETTTYEDVESGFSDCISRWREKLRARET